jgi:pyruvate/2-oxoglutarate dehydrogenase complex dihydrolipoamide dehydrogenase (E3) component
LGTKVSVVELFSQILSADDKDLTDIVMDILKAEDVEFYLDSSVISTRDLGDEKEVVFKKGNETKSLRAEVLLVATGRKANIEGMGLQDVGVKFNKRGLNLDAKLRTTQRHIYGAGDVTGTYQFTHAAGYEGGVVLSNAIFHFPKRVNYTLFPWVTYSDPELGSIGMNEKAAQAAGIKYSVWTEEFKDNDRSLAEGEKTGKVKMLLDEKEKPIGIQILGPHAGDLLNEWVTVMNGKVKLTTLASAVHPYPTLGEINKRVAGSFIGTKVFSEKVKKGLKLFFHLKGRACGEPSD